MNLSECVVHPESFPEVVGWIDPKDVAEFIKKILVQKCETVEGLKMFIKQRAGPALTSDNASCVNLK